MTVGAVPPVSYEQNYQEIAQVHLGSLREGRGNPWMDAEDITLFARRTADLVETYTEPGGAVLDAGCGPGELELELNTERFKVTGLDLSADYLAFAQERVSGVEWVQGEIERMPFRRRFDTVVCADVLEHVLHLDDCVRQLLRVLKPGGHLIVRVPIESSLSPYISGNPFWFVHMRRFAGEELLLLFTRGFGCEVLQVTLCPRASGQPPSEVFCVARKPE